MFPDITDKIVCIDVETTGIKWYTDKIFGFSLAMGGHEPMYYDIRRTPSAVHWLQDQLPHVKLWVNHHIKFDVNHMLNLGVKVNTDRLSCTMLRAALIDEHLFSYSLDDLAKKYVGAQKDAEIYQELSALFGGRATRSVQMKNLPLAPPEIVGRYAKQDALVAYKLWKWQEEEIERQGLQKVVKLEHDLLPVVIRMERHGVRIDEEQANKAAKEIDIIVAKERQALDKLAGFEVNFNPSGSIKRLFDPKLVDGKWVLVDGTVAGLTDAGAASIDAECLRRMKHPAAEKILRLRKLTKTADTFLRGHILGHAHKGRVYCNINQTKGDNDAGTGCMTADTLILTNMGWLPVTDVKIGMKVVDHHGEPQKVIDHFENGVCPIYKITTSGGHVIKVTGNHPFLSDGEFVRADKLVAGSGVVVYGEPEKFKPIKGLPEGWTVSSWGRIISPSGKQRRQQGKGEWGHLKITIGSQKTVRIDKTVHRLVAESFDIEGDRGHNIIMHKNGIAWDNSVQNLAWGSCRDNNIAGAAHGSYYHQSKLTPEDVEFIRTCDYLSAPQLGRAFSVSRELIRDILSGKKWDRRELVKKRLIYGLDTIASIEVLPPEMTYGVEVESTHTHLTNGIVTHNTGRLSINDPALQQIPARDKEVKSIVRPCFLPDVGQKWVGADWAQMDFRMMAHYTRVQSILQRFYDDPKTDFHQIVSDMTGLPRGPRFAGDANAKQINLGLVFGMGQGKLAAEMGLPYTMEEGRGGRVFQKPGHEAMAVFEKYHTAVPGVKEFLDRASSVARSRGYVISVMGRHLRFPGGLALHKAGGYLFQSACADAMKVKMIEFDRFCPENGGALLLTVHDELGLSMPVDCDTSKVKELFTRFDGVHTPLKFRIPIDADVGIGDNWYEGK